MTSAAHQAIASGARVDQVARLLGLSEREVVVAAANLVPPMPPEKGRLSADAVLLLTSNVKPRRSTQEAEALIRQAFANARASGAGESMSLPVFKNRLLQIDSTFDEIDWGAPTLSYFALAFPDLLVLEESHPHNRVRLSGAEAVPSSTPAQLDVAAGKRLRPDLWRAWIDYASGHTYYWDKRRGRALVAPVGTASAAPGPVIPTVTPEQLGAWRVDFKTGLADVDKPDDITRISEWVDQASAAVNLPPRIRWLWNAYLKNRIAESIREFFVANELEMPTDIFVESAKPKDSNDRLTAHKLIDLMTEQELSTLAFPLSAISRLF